MTLRGSHRVYFIMCAFLAAAFALRGEEARKKDVVADPSPAWIVAVASFDTEKLAAADRLAGDLIVNRLSQALSSIGTRQYADAERGAYMRYLVRKATNTAVKELAAKQAARDALLFSGLEYWKYKIELKKADETVRAAREVYDLSLRALAEVPPVKVVKIAKENAGGVLIAPPKNGEERSFCEQHAYDALLLGRVESFYGRTFASIRLYSPFLNGNLYSDETTFSTADRETVLAELALRLAAAVSGTPPALVSVRVDPPETDVHLNGVFSGIGAVGPVERAPGSLRVTAERSGYERFEETVDVFSSERTDLSITLPAVKTTSLAVSAFGASEGKSVSNVRVNGLFVGRTPMTLTLPQGTYSFVQLDSADAGASNSPSQNSSSVATAVNSQADGAISLQLVDDLPKSATPAEDARKAFYGAFGRFSLFMPIAFIVSGIAFSYDSAAIKYNSTELADLTAQVKLASTVLWTVSGIFVVESVFRFVNYLRSSGSRAAKSTQINGS